ncbi:MAG: hypothetical protein WC023_03800 [Rhodocyclaceae bacterium]
MNKYQRLVMIVALIDALIMILFPPFNSQPLARNMPGSFDGYYPLFSALGSKPINTALLTLQLMFVGANALAAWLVLQTKVHHQDIPTFRYIEGIGWFVALNLTLVFLFPPFEPYQSLQKNPGSTFDSFYFVFGDRSKRPFYIPLLQLEVMWVMINALAFWLLFNAVKRNDDLARLKILSLAESLPDDQLEKITAEIQHRIEEHHAHDNPALGRGTDRRHVAEPAFPGPDRRTGHDRRDKH